MPGQRQLPIGEVERVTEGLGRGIPPEDPSEQPVQPRVVERAERVRDDDRRHEARDLLDRLAPVLVDVHDDVGRGKLPDPVDLDVLGAADLRDGADDVSRMDAEPGSADELRSEPEIAEQLGDARNEADDPRVGPGWLVPHAGSIDQFTGPGHMLRRYSPPTS